MTLPALQPAVIRENLNEHRFTEVGSVDLDLGAASEGNRGGPQLLAHVTGNPRKDQRLGITLYRGCRC
jgi:hypothetical protein